nr:long-chain fatty acid--CoA ligase [Candidatus Sigynarchaeum springense]
MAKRFDSIGKMFQETVSTFGNRVFFKWRDDANVVRQMTYLEVSDHVAAISGALASIGIQQGDRVTIFSETRPEWIYTDLGILSLGAITVTIYPTLTPPQAKYIIDDSDTRVIFVDSKENLEKVIELLPTLPTLEIIVIFDPMTADEISKLKVPAGKIHALSGFLEMGRAYVKDHAGFPADRIALIKEDELSSIIYTSGTTGVPKGVMLTHRNFLSNAVTCSEIIKMIAPKIKPYEQNSLTFMPLSHVFCRCCEEFVAIYNGACLCFAMGRSPDLIESGFKVFRPRLMAGIPYIYEKVHKRIFEKVKGYPAKMQKIFADALDFGKAYNKILAAGQKPPLKMRLKRALFSSLVYKTVHKQLGGRLIGFVSGSAHLPEQIAEDFWALDIRIIDGYGLTETSPVTHFMRTLENSDFRPGFTKRIHPLAKLGSVGPPIEFPGNPYPNVEAKIAADEEILIRGPNVMKGYWKLPEETRATIEPDGWLHTGDLGRIDEDGYLFITGRKKQIIKLSTGKMVAPASVEDKLITSEFILQVLIVGSEQKYITAFIVPSQKAIKEFADQQGIPSVSYKELLRNEVVLQRIKKEIADKSTGLAGFETVKKFAVFGQEFNEQDGYLTPTLKCKASRILADFKDVVNQLYETDKDYIVVERKLVDYHPLTIPG